MTRINVIVDLLRDSRLRHVNSALTAIIWLLAVFALVQNAHLIRRARAVVEAEKAAIFVNPGSHLTAITGLTLEATLSRSLFPRPDNKQLLLITFAPDCPTCREMIPRWKLLASQLDQTGNWTILWISRASVDNTRKYALYHGLPIHSVIADPSYILYRTLRMEYVPQMIAVSPSGFVGKVWIGDQHWSVDDVKYARGTSALGERDTNIPAKNW